MGAVEERPEPQRIEIELTSHDPAGPRPAAPVPPVAGATTEVTSGRGWLDTERGRLVAATAFVGVVALLIGVLVGGRVGPDDSAAVRDVTSTTPGDAPDDAADSASDTAPNTATADESTTTTTGGNVAALPSVEPPATPPPSSTDSSTDSSITVSTSGSLDVLPTVPGQSAPIAIAPTAAGLPVEVIAQQSDGDLVIIDLASGTARERETEVPPFGGPGVLYAGSDWILFADLNSGSSTLLRDDGSVERARRTDGFPMMVVPGTDRMWVTEFAAGTNEWWVREYRVDGTPTGKEISAGGDVPVGGPGAWPQMVDPRGGVVVIAAGGSYVVDEVSTTRVSTGWLLAIGQRQGVAYECDDALECAYVVVDRESGERQPIELDPSLGASSRIEAGIWQGGVPLFDATEEQLLITAWDDSGDRPVSFGVLDLRTGDYLEIVRDIPQGMHWGPDGRHVFWLDSRNDIMVFDVEAGVSLPLSGDLERVRAFTLRTPPPGEEG